MAVFYLTPFCLLQGESLSFDPEVSGPKGRMNPSPYHVENPAKGGGEGELGGEVKIKGIKNER